MRIIIVIVAIGFLASGCALGVLAGGIGYAVSSSKSADAEQTKSDALMAEKYNQYRIEMEKINLEREKAKLKPQPIMEYSEWVKQTQNTTPLQVPEAKKQTAESEVVSQ